MPLTPDDQAPDFTLLDQHGEPFTLSASIEQRRAAHLIYFYPKANTPGCTQQSCLLRDIAGQIGDTRIVGISPDKPAAQLRFDEKYGLGFPLLADTEHTVAEAYGVWKQKSMYGRQYMGVERSAFFVDAQGVVRHAWYKISPKDTPTRLLEALEA